MKPDPHSEIARRADEIREAAKTAGTVRGLADAFRWSMESARHANQALELGLPEAALRPAIERTEGKAHPKPVKRK
jgi:hypothetical protein